nr:helix-turn-helix domain-containing protein [Kribbella solani]
MRALADADRRGSALPYLAHALGQPLSATEHRLHQLLEQGLVQQLDTGDWAATSPGLSTWGPESPTSTHLLVAAAGVHAGLAVAAATVAGLIDKRNGASEDAEALLWEKAVS